MFSQGPADLRSKVRNIPSRDASAPFFGVLLNLGRQGAYTGSQWVGAGKLDAGAVTISASTIFPNAAKGLQLALITDLDMFDFPSSGCNFSSYREVPYQVPVVAYMGKEMITWERATELGARDFCMRVVVLPVSTREVLVQVGVSPMSLDELKESFGEVFEQPYFPNTMVKVSKSQNKLPSFMGNKTSSLVKPVELVLEDTEGMGMGVLPFTTTSSSASGDSYTEVERPPVDVIKAALFNHMHAGFKPVARTAARMREALDVALQADKAEENVLPPLWSPWPTVLEGGADAVANVDQGMSAPLLVK